MQTVVNITQLHSAYETMNVKKFARGVPASKNQIF